jgi:hypothetical protein
MWGNAYISLLWIYIILDIKGHHIALYPFLTYNDNKLLPYFYTVFYLSECSQVYYLKDIIIVKREVR